MTGLTRTAMVAIRKPAEGDVPAVIVKMVFAAHHHVAAHVLPVMSPVTKGPAHPSLQVRTLTGNAMDMIGNVTGPAMELVTALSPFPTTIIVMIYAVVQGSAWKIIEYTDVWMGSVHTLNRSTTIASHTNVPTLMDASETVLMILTAARARDIIAITPLTSVSMCISGFTVWSNLFFGVLMSGKDSL